MKKGQDERDFKFHRKNRVIIRIWTSKFNKNMPGENVGHVSIQVLDTYMSLWPAPRDHHDSSENGKKRAITNIFEERPPQYMYSFIDDEIAENRDPEYTVCLYTLKQRVIVEKFNELKTTIKGWTLLGANKLINSGSSESCASLAYQLLKAGDIYELISLSYSSENSIVTSPDSLSRVVLAAKEYEFEYYPETKDYKYEDETQLSVTSDQLTDDGKCFMM
jgi:hypothetical protein